jgi:hypothetical protein
METTIGQSTTVPLSVDGSWLPVILSAAGGKGDGVFVRKRNKRKKKKKERKKRKKKKYGTCTGGQRARHTQLSAQPAAQLSATS